MDSNGMKCAPIIMIIVVPEKKIAELYLKCLICSRVSQSYRKLFEKIYNLIFSGSFHDHNQGNDTLPICIICTFWNILWNTLLGLNKIKDLTKLLLTSFKLFILWSIAIILHYLTRNKYIYFHKLIFYHYRYLYWFMPPKKHFHTIENVIIEHGSL